jgi:hypothetical protein
LPREATRRHSGSRAARRAEGAADDDRRMRLLHRLAQVIIGGKLTNSP